MKHLIFVFIGCSSLLAIHADISSSQEFKTVSSRIKLAQEQIQQGKLESAYEILMQVLNESPCKRKALHELEKIGLEWKNAQDKQSNVLEIYGLLNHCKPHNPDILYFLGVHLARAERWDEAETVLKECLYLMPKYADAEIQLGFLYLWRNQTDLAESIFARHSGNADAQMGMARIYQKRGETGRAQAVHRQIVDQNPNHREARRLLARSLASEMNYSDAKSHYAWLIDNDPNTPEHFAELLDVKSHTNFAIYLESFYTDAKENDPTLKAPVVKDYYFFNAVHFLIPLLDRWRLDLKQIYFHQRENDIYPPIGVNYSVYLAGAQVTSSWLFYKDWKWDLYARSFEAWGQQDVSYPFHRTTRLEPGTALVYNSERQLFVFDAHRESFIIKNFARLQSELLRTDFLAGVYRYRIPVALQPELEAQAAHIFIQGDNWNNTEAGIARCKIPWIKYFTAIYRFDHGHFDKLNPNYYSFKQQLMNTLGVRLHCDFYSNVYFETTYEHRWKTTYQLYQPIGNYIFVADKQYLIANKIISKLSCRYRDSFRFELEGHYFYESLPYRDWNISGSLLWQF